MQREAAEAPPREALRAPAPIGLSEIIGHERAIETIRSVLRSGRVPHAWLLSGPAGVGKFTTALAFAAVLLDPTSRPIAAGEIEPEVDSRAQRLLRAGAHPHLHVVRKELTPFSRDDRVRGQLQRSIPVEILREFLIEPATMKAWGERGAMASKVFIVDEAELMNESGQNALLKSLEEPPPGTVIMLVTSSEERLLPTIRSRAQRISFGPLSSNEMGRWLARMGVDLTAGQRRALDRFACGSPGAAQVAIETGMIGWVEILEPHLDDVAAGRFPIRFGMTAAGLVDDWAKRWVDTHAGASKEAANHAGAGHLFHLIGEHYRASLAGGATDDSKARRLVRAIELADRAQRWATANVNLLFVLDDWAAQACA